MLSGVCREQGQAFRKALQPMHHCWPAAPCQPLCHLNCLQYHLSSASRLLLDTAAASARLSGCCLLHTLHMPMHAPWLPADKQKREVYDRFGEEGLKGGMPPGGGGMPGGMGAGGMPGGMPQGFRFNPRSAEDIFAEVGPHVVLHCCTRVCCRRKCGTLAYLGRSLPLKQARQSRAGLGAATHSGWQH